MAELDLELSEFEKGYLTGFFDSLEMTHPVIYDEETEWHGVDIGSRVFDIAVYLDDDDQIIGKVYECHKRSGEYYTDVKASWFIDTDRGLSEETDGWFMWFEDGNGAYITDKDDLRKHAKIFDFDADKVLTDGSVDFEDDDGNIVGGVYHDKS